MISKKIIFFIILIGSTAVVASANAEPTVTIIMEKTTYTYCEKLVYSIEVSEITGEHAIIHIRDGAGGKSSAIPIPIEKLSNPIPSLHAFEKDIFPLGKYFIDVEYLGMQTTAEFTLIDSNNMCISEAMQPVVVRWINGEFTDGMLISGFQNIVDKKLIDIPFEFTEKNIDSLHIPEWVKSVGKGWVMGIISDQMFVQNIQYLIDEKINSFPIDRENEI
ncbi:MAG: hypothetical protein H8E89_06555 [Candidatus Nitrosopelagicus sp.]|nr:hypothetical protein [Candidatus Nitrosopelagicus sp.]